MAKIILVDDDELVLKSVAMLLKNEGHEVTVFSDGRLAKETLQKEKYDLMVADIRMEPMSGIELLGYSREHHPDMPCIVISACNTEQNIADCNRLGCVAFFCKPFDPTAFIAAVHQALAPPLRDAGPPA